jgi:hypothetical protein
MTHLLKFAGTPPTFTAGLPSRSAFPFWPTEARLPPTPSAFHRHVGLASQTLLSPTFSPPSVPRDGAVGQGGDASRASPHGRRLTSRASQMRATPPEIALHRPSLYPETLALPYKWNPHPHLPVRRRLGDFAPVHR